MIPPTDFGLKAAFEAWLASATWYIANFVQQGQDLWNDITPFPTDQPNEPIINADPLPESLDGFESYGPLEAIDYGFLPSPLDAGVDVGISVFPLPEEQGMMVHSANWKDLPKPLHSWGKQMSKLPLKKMKERLETHRGTLSRHERKYADALKRGIRSEEVERMRQEIEFLERLIDKRTK